MNKLAHARDQASFLSTPKGFIASMNPKVHWSILDFLICFVKFMSCSIKARLDSLFFKNNSNM